MQKGSLYVIIAAVFWGTIPFFGRTLSSLHIDALSSAAARAYFAAIILLAICAASGDLFKVKIKDLKFFLLVGAIVVTGTYSFYLLAIEHLSTAMAAILLYTAPSFVVVFSRIFFKEAFTVQKIAALLLAIFGSFLVVRGYDFSSLKINGLGIFFGVMSGLCYSMFTIFGRMGLGKYNPQTNVTLQTAAGALVFFLIRPPWSLHIESSTVLLCFIAIAVLGSVVPYFLYLKAMQGGLEGSRASILATLEPIMVAILGFLVFKELLELPQLIGMLITISGAILVCLPQKNALKQSQ